MCDCVCESPTISRRTWLEAQGRAEARAVVEAPALLDLARAGGLRDVLLGGRLPHVGARRQRRRLVPDGLGRSRIVHPDPIPEANFTADSEEDSVKHPETRLVVSDHDTMSMPLTSMGN